MSNALHEPEAGMKRFAAISLLLFVFSLSGCVSGRELADDIARPSHIYDSGKDLLSGTYDVLPNPDAKDRERHEITVRKIADGWDVSQPDAAGFDLFEETPEQVAKLFHSYHKNTMQCGKGFFATLCAAPKGTKTRDGKMTVKTGYILFLADDTVNHVERKR